MNKLRLPEIREHYARVNRYHAVSEMLHELEKLQRDVMFAVIGYAMGLEGPDGVFWDVMLGTICQRITDTAPLIRVGCPVCKRT